MTEFTASLRLRRYAVLALLLLPLILLCGKLLLTPVSRGTSWWEYSTIRVTMNGTQHVPVVQERGWPWVFAARHGRIDLGFSPARLLADIAVLLALVATFGLLLARHRRDRGRWLSVSLRELFAVTTLVACALGFWVYHVRLRQREEQVSSQFQVSQVSSLHVEYCGPEPLRRLLPDELLGDFAHVSSTWVVSDWFWHQNPERRDQFLTAIHSLPYVRKLDFGPGAFEGLVKPPESSDNSFAPDGASGPVWPSSFDMSAFERIEEVTFPQLLVDDDVLTLVAELPRLRSLQAGGRRVTDRGIDRLMRHDQLEQLELFSTNITDAGVARLAQSRRLRVLRLGSPQLTDDAAASLTGLETLEDLEIIQCHSITEEGVKQLLAAPRLKWLAISPSEEITPATLDLLRTRIPYIAIEQPRRRR